MSDLLKNIDKAQIEMGKEKEYKIEGWCVFKDRRPYSIQVRGDKNTEIPCRLEKVCREDVGKALRDPSVSDVSGFAVYISNLEEIIKQYKEIGLFAAFSQGEEEIYSVEVQKIKKEYGNTIFYNLDEILVQKRKGA